MKLDHLVLTVADVQASARFYGVLFGMTFSAADGRFVLAEPNGVFRIHLHALGAERTPHAKAPTPGSADLCFVSDDPLEARLEALRRCGIALELGPVERQDAAGALQSIYFRDPDGNLIEWAAASKAPAGVV